MFSIQTGQVPAQHNAGLSPAAPQQNNASNKGQIITTVSGQPIIGSSSSTSSSLGTFSLSSLLSPPTLAMGLLYLAEQAFAAGNNTNGTDTEQAQEGSGFPGWATAVIVGGLLTAAGVGLCAYKNKEKFCPTERQQVPNEPPGGEAKELEDMEPTGETKAATEKTEASGPLLDTAEASSHQQSKVHDVMTTPGSDSPPKELLPSEQATTANA